MWSNHVDLSIRTHSPLREVQIEEEAEAVAAMKKVAGSGGDAVADKKTGKTLGCQKIEMKLITSSEARHVCFSKRRSGLFKKATELNVLCGAHVAAVLFSPAERPFSYGHPSVDAVVQRFLDPASSVAAPAAAVLHDFECEKDRLVQAVEAEARRKEALDAAARAAGVWTDGDVQRAGLPDLVAMLRALEPVLAEEAARSQEIIAEEAMMQQYTTATDAGGVFPYLGAGTFTASYQAAVMGSQMMVMGGNVGHEPPFLPMMQTPPPPPPLNFGFDYNLMAGYGYGLGDGSGHDAAYEMEELYGTKTCNFFQ